MWPVRVSVACLYEAVPLDVAIAWLLVFVFE